MEETKGNGDHMMSALHISGSLKSSPSGRYASKSSPSVRRLHSGRILRREGKVGSGSYHQWFGGNRVVFWLILITMWAYLGFYVQSKWAHGEHQQKEFIRKSEDGSKQEISLISITGSSDANGTKSVDGDSLLLEGGEESGLKKPVANLAKKGKRRVLTRSNAKRYKNSKTTGMVVKRELSSDTNASPNVVMVANKTANVEDMVPRKNTSYGLLVGPFGKTEDNVLEWSPDKRKGTCDRRSEFARLVWSRRFVLVIHDLHMTQAPITMMELATELLSCGGYVHVITLSTKGDLGAEMKSRGIKVLEKGELSTKTAMRSDLVIAGSAACWSWVEDYYKHFTIGSSQVLWWIMENKQIYFNRSKHVLNEVKMLAFLSETQSKQWLAWCEEEKIKLKMEPAIVPLAIADELAFVAGIPCSLNTPSFSIEKMQEKRTVLRDTVRKEMGLSNDDILLTTLTDINSGKGQSLLLESFLMMSEQNLPPIDVKIESFLEERYTPVTSDVEAQLTNNKLGMDLLRTNGTDAAKKKKKKTSRRRGSRKSRALLSESEGTRKDKNVKILIGSVGAKRNSASYVKGLLSFLSQHSNLSKSVLWTPATSRVASLYAASDAFVINSQGFGETFGRVTIEAMAFSLPVENENWRNVRKSPLEVEKWPVTVEKCLDENNTRPEHLEPMVLGTDLGGTKEIVDDKITALLHPVGREGIQPLAENIQFLLNNPSARELLGKNGRQKVEKMYLKKHMYMKLGKVLVKCMKTIK